VRCFEQIQKTRLQAPFEYVDFHFLIEGVTRSFTHQMVRQRTAVYSQESLRFAVKEDAAQGVALPPSLGGTTGEWERVYREVWKENEKQYEDGSLAAELEERIGRLSDAEQKRYRWDNAVERMTEAYELLVDSGMPAEDARGLLPHSITTRLHYKTNLRNLLEHSGNRLCTQAQHEWKTVFALIKKAIREAPDTLAASTYLAHRWQYEKIADMFLPICYQLGKCGFKASFDRPCKIRNRVDANEALNRPSSEWNKEHDVVPPDAIVAGVGPQSVVRDEKNVPVFIGAIRPAEWLLDPFAARGTK
jgi:flavin-dependent thymidylate synthase